MVKVTAKAEGANKKKKKNNINTLNRMIINQKCLVWTAQTHSRLSLDIIEHANKNSLFRLRVRYI